jgi:hypothetical protein
MSSRFATFLTAAIAMAALTTCLRADPMGDLVRQCDLIAEIHVISSTPLAKVEIKYSDDDWKAKFAAVPSEDKFSKVLPTGSFNGWFDSRTARIVTPIRGCRQGELIKIDFNNLMTDTNTPGENIVFENEERCLAFLRKYPDGHYGAVDQKHGRMAIADDTVPGWRGGSQPVPIAAVLQQLREWAAAVARDKPAK